MCDSSELPAGPPPPYEAMVGHEDAPLTGEMLVRYQYIALAPAIATNFRFVVHTDGQLFYAHNSSEPNDPIFNTSLPDSANRTLSQIELASILTAISAVDFFAQPNYLAVKSRGGALMIVTIRLDGKTHEVWYENANNELLEVLHAITPEPPANPSVEDQLGFWDSLWEES